ncbi:MAG: hypothetical protein AAFY24_01830 [Pseudomonadota bacterium]
MADGGEVNGLRDRVTKLEFETSQKPSKDFVQTAMENALRTAGERDRERNEALVKVFDERLGANRSAILTDLARDHQEFREEVREMLKTVVKEEVPGAVRAEVRAIKAEEELAEQKRLAEEEKAKAASKEKWLIIKLRATTITAVILLFTALIGVYYALKGDTEPREVHQLGKVSDALTSIQ